MTNSEIKAACEAVLFACGESVNAKRIARALEIDEKPVEEQLEKLVEEYSDDSRGVSVLKLNDSYLMCNKRAHGETIRKVMDMKKTRRFLRRRWRCWRLSPTTSPSRRRLWSRSGELTAPAL